MVSLLQRVGLSHALLPTFATRPPISGTRNALKTHTVTDVCNFDRHERSPTFRTRSEMSWLPVSELDIVFPRVPATAIDKKHILGYSVRVTLRGGGRSTVPPRPTNLCPSVKPQVSRRLGRQSSHPISDHFDSKAVISTMKSTIRKNPLPAPSLVYKIHDPGRWQLTKHFGGISL